MLNILIASNIPILTCLGSQLLDKKFTTKINISCTPCNTQRSNMQVVKRHPLRAYCTQFDNVFYIKKHITSSTKTHQNGKTTLWHNTYASLCNQMDFTFLNGIHLLITKNIKSSKNSFLCLMVLLEGICEKQQPWWWHAM